VLPRVSDIVAALEHIAGHPEFGVDVVTMSLGTGDQFAGECDNATAYTQAGKSAVDALRADGVTVFASAGNNSSGSLMGAPACLSNVVAVGATDTADDVAGFSNSNSATDVFAPGVDVVSDATGGGTISLSGTSMASPTAAACAALIRRARPTATPAAIETTLESTGVAVTDVTHGLTFPRIDCAAAVGPVGGAPTVSISDAGVVEGNSATRPATFAVSLSAASTQTVSVRYATADGTAVAPGDYTAKAGTLLTFQRPDLQARHRHGHGRRRGRARRDLHRRPHRPDQHHHRRRSGRRHDHRRRHGRRPADHQHLGRIGDRRQRRHPPPRRSRSPSRRRRPSPSPSGTPPPTAPRWHPAITLPRPPRW
jgi:hypothetical protein